MTFAVTHDHWLALAQILFFVGLLGALLRRNALVVLMSIELMLNAGNLTLAVYGHRYAMAETHVIIFFLLAIAAAEAAVGLALMLNISRTHDTLNLDAMTSLRELL